MGIKHQGHPKYYFLHYNKLIINVNLWGLKNLRKSGVGQIIVHKNFFCSLCDKTHPDNFKRISWIISNFIDIFIEQHDDFMLLFPDFRAGTPKFIESQLPSFLTDGSR